MPRQLLLLLVSWISLMACSGCAHYQLGTSAELEFGTLYVVPVKMVALVPQAEPVITAQLRSAFVRDGRVELSNSETLADATLTVIVRDYHREVATVRSGDTGLARKFIVTLTAEATLTDNRSGKVYFKNRPLVAKRDLYTDSGQQQAEYQLLPMLAEDLAAKASHAVLDTW